jgi:micrococcal nuclease
MARRKRRTAARRWSSRWQQVLFWAAVLAALAALYRFAPHGSAVPESLEPGVYRVERVIDGDTLQLANGVTVRLIGADTPETVRHDHPVERFGREATRFTRQFVSGGEVRLQFDGDRLDKYGRLLALVWVGDRMLNEELIRQGLARARTEFSYSEATKARFLRAQAKAQAAGRGIWSEPLHSGGRL